MSDLCCSYCRSPRRQRPMTSAPAAQPAMTGSISLFALPRPTLAGTSLPLSHEGQMFSRRGTLRSASVSSAPASSAPHACADTPMPSAQPGASLPLLHSSDPLGNDRVSILRSAGAQLPWIKWQFSNKVALYSCCAVCHTGWLDVGHEQASSYPARCSEIGSVLWNLNCL